MSVDRFGSYDPADYSGHDQWVELRGFDELEKVGEGCGLGQRDEIDGGKRHRGDVQQEDG